MYADTKHADASVLQGAWPSHRRWLAARPRRRCTPLHSHVPDQLPSITARNHTFSSDRGRHKQPRVTQSKHSLCSLLLLCVGRRGGVARYRYRYRCPRSRPGSRPRRGSQCAPCTHPGGGGCGRLLDRGRSGGLRGDRGGVLLGRALAGAGSHGRKQRQGGTADPETAQIGGLWPVAAA